MGQSTAATVLIERSQPAAPANRVDLSPEAKRPEDEVLQVSLEALQVNPYQPRKVMGESELAELADQHPDLESFFERLPKRLDDYRALAKA